MSASRVVKSDEDITMTEVTQSDGKAIISRAYAVRAGREPTFFKTFGDMAAADIYFEELVMHRPNP